MYILLRMFLYKSTKTTVCNKLVPPGSGFSLNLPHPSSPRQSRSGTCRDIGNFGLHSTRLKTDGAMTSGLEG
jgi:hypothetical protein